MPKFQHKDGKQTVIARSLQILGEAAKSEVSDYISPITELKSDADELFKSLNAGKATSREAFNDFRKNGMKKFIDWFYGDGIMGDSSLEDEDSDFDASSLLADIDDDGGDKEEKSSVLNEDSMKDIARGHVNAMTKITGKQVEASVMSTAEIVTTIKHESSLITSALNTSNQHLAGIEQKLDAMLKLQQMGLQQQAELTETQQGLVNDEGRITLKTLTQSIKQAFLDSQLGTIVDLAGGVKEGMGPAELLSAVLGMSGIKDKQFKIFGDRSFNELGEEIQRTISNSISGAFDSLIDSKFSKYIQDLAEVNIRAGAGNVDYSIYGKNQYTRDKAVFDNMTRESIIHIIPEYLRMITGALTGKNYHITENGKLSSLAQKDGFKEQIKQTSQAVNSEMTRISDNKLFSKMETIDVSIDQSRYRELKKFIIGAGMQYSLNNGIDRLSPSDVMSGEFQTYVKTSVITVMRQFGNKSNLAYLENLLDSFLLTMVSDRGIMTEYINDVSRNTMHQRKHLTSFAQQTRETQHLRSIDTENNEILVSMADNKSQQQKAQEQIERERDEAVKKLRDQNESTRKINKLIADYDKKIDESNRKFENAWRGGDTYADMEKVQSEAHAAITKGFNGKIFDNEAYQKDVTATIHSILDVLNIAFSDKLIAPVQPAIRPNHQRQRYTIKSQAKPKQQSQPVQQTQPIQQDTGIGDQQQTQPVQPEPIVSQPNQPTKQDTSKYNLDMDQSHEITESVDNLKDVMLVGNIMSMANADGNMNEDSQVITQALAGMADKVQATKIKGMFQKLAKNAGDKVKAIKEEPKSLISMLMSGASKLFAPITMLLKPVTLMFTKIFKPALALIKRNLKSGFEQAKKGWQQVKEGFSDATEGIRNKVNDAKDSIKKKFGIKGKSGDSTEDGDTDTGEDGIAKPKNGDEPKSEVAEEIKKGTEQAKQNDEHAETRHNVIKELLSKIYDRIEKGFTTDKSKTEDTPATVKNSNESGIGTQANQQQPKKQSNQSGTYNMSFGSGTDATFITGKSGGAEYTVADTTSTLADAGMQQATVADSGTIQAGVTNAGSAVNTATNVASNTAGKTIGKIGFGLLKVASGSVNILAAIGKILLTIVASMAAVKTAVSLVTRILKKSLRPLNKAIRFLTKTLKPLIKKLGNIIESIANVVVSLVQSLGKLLKPIVQYLSKALEVIMDLISPVLEALSPVIEKISDILGNILSTFMPFAEKLQPMFEMLGDALGEILTTIGDLISNILNPLWEAFEPMIEMLFDVQMQLITPWFTLFKTVLVPLIKIMSGVIQTNLGALVTGLGIITEGIGKIVSKLTFGLAGSKIEEAGQKMAASGATMVQTGIETGVEGFKNLLGMETEKKDNKVSTDNDVTLPNRNASSGMTLDGTVTDSLYGSGDQASYGTYLNMSKRGCGPIALAEAASARTGQRVDPRALAGSMAASGNYSTSRGTSVAGFVNQAAGMGLGYTAGGVTANSLRTASPTNPVTVVGSGNGFGTKNGNIHYVNVIGTNGNIAYTSNPLSGRVERRTVSELTSRGLLGLYGSGDTDLGAAFGDDIADMFADLAEKAGNLFNIFNFDDAGSVAEQQKKLELEEKVKNLKMSLGADKMAEIEKEAFKQWAESHPKKNNESAQSYLARWNKHKNEIIVEVAQKYSDEKTSDFFGTIGDTVADAITGLFGVYDAETQTWSGGASQLGSQLLEALNLDAAEMGVGSTGFGGGGSSSSGGNGGSVLGMVPAVVKAYEAVGVVGKSGDYNQSGRTHKLTINGQTYTERPDCTGLCDSVIDSMGYNSEGMNSARFQSAKGIKDSSGNISADWQMIDKPELSSLQGGDIAIIYNGSAHHGEIVSGVEGNTVYGFSYGWEGGMARALAAVNEMLNGTDALTATKNNRGQINGHKYYTRAIRYVGGGGTGDGSGNGSGMVASGSLSGGTTEQQIWAYLTQVLGFTPEGAAGVMGNMQAESGMKPNNLEDIFNSRIGMSDSEYTQAVDSGAYSRAKFISDHTKAGCGAGYGLVQFTAQGLKEALYDIAKRKGVSISDVGAQMDAINQTVDSGLVSKLKSTHNISEASDLWLTKYERPAKMEAAKPKRRQNAQSFYDKYSTWNGSGVTVNANSNAYTINSQNATAAQPQSIDMTRLSQYYNNTWNHYKDRDGISNYFAAAQQAGMSPAQQALIMSVGIWEDGAKKLLGQKDLTKVTHDVNGQAAFGIMNWIPKNIVNEHDNSYGSTMQEQLNYISNAYFGQNPSRAQGRINDNINQYGPALMQLTGHELIGKKGDAIGPIVDQDLVEGAGHYTGVALVPAGWNTPQGLGKYVGTAADVYNWMIQNGMATGQVSGGTGSTFGSGGGSGIYGTIGSRVRQLLDAGTLNANGNSALSAAINLALQRGTPMTSALTGLTKFALSDTGQNILSTAIDTAGSVVNTAANGVKDLISNRVTTAGKLVSTWWDGVKNTGSSIVGGVSGAVDAAKNVSEAGILQTFKDVGSSLYEGATGAVGSVFDTAGQEFQVLYDGAKNEVDIIKGTAEEVGSQIADAVAAVASQVIGTETVGDSTKGSKLQNMLKGNYGTVAYFNPGSETLLQAYNSQLAVSMGWGLGQQSQSSGSSVISDYGSYDDSGTEETSAFTVAPVADNSDMWNGYEQAVDARTKSNWKKKLDEGMKEWGAVTRNGKAPENWWNKYLTNQRIADYYRTEYPQANVNQAFSTWYQSKFYKSTAQQNKEAAGGITNARLLAQKLAYTDKPKDMVQLLKQYPKFASDAQVKKQFTDHGYEKYYNNALKSINNTNYNSGAMLSSGSSVLSTINAGKSAAGLYGSGDETSVIAIPPVDTFALQQQLMQMEQPIEQQLPTVVNQYLVGQDTSSDTTWIDRLNQITFNVRAERVEELLQDISDKLDSINTGGTAVITPPANNDESNYYIPESVAKLARG